PLYWDELGLRVGVQVVGRPGAEATLYRLASRLEEARPWRDRRPPVSELLREPEPSGQNDDQARDDGRDHPAQPESAAVRPEMPDLRGRLQAWRTEPHALGHGPSIGRKVGLRRRARRGREARRGRGSPGRSGP